jgi:hypothetical protein
MPATPRAYRRRRCRQARALWEMIMRAIASARLALSILAGFAAQAVAYDPHAHDAKRFFAERDPRGAIVK